MWGDKYCNICKAEKDDKMKCERCGQDHTDKSIFECKMCQKILCSAQITTDGPYYQCWHIYRDWFQVHRCGPCFEKS